MSIYYQNQISAALAGTEPKIKIINQESNETNFLDLNDECIDVLICQLIRMKKSGDDNKGTKNIEFLCEAEILLTHWLTDNTEIFEDEAEVDEARSLIQERLVQ